MDSSDSGLRQRPTSTLPDKNNKKNKTKLHNNSNTSSASSSSSSSSPSMAIRSRPAIAYSRLPSGTGAGAPGNNRTVLGNYRNNILIFLCITILYTAFLYKSGGARSYLGMTTTTSRHLQISTFNVAAINNNPFEYWLTMPENPGYEDLMGKIEDFIENPGDKDVLVSQVFTPTMFEQLDQRLTQVAGWTSVKNYWETDFSKRSIVNGFLKDTTLGSKRLASMPDRVTNSITTSTGQAVFRPSVISMYEKDLNNQEMWWKAWQAFMFDDKLSIKDKTGKVEEKAPWAMLQRIKKSKYPAITEQEETDSLPLQTLCSAILDGILVHMMNTVSKPSTWQPLKRTIVENLNKQKVPHTLKILETQYLDSNVLMLQEVSSAMVDQARKSRLLSKTFQIVTPANLDTVRDQNSIILLNKKTFLATATTEITQDVQSMFPKGEKVPVADGDILAIVTTNAAGEHFVIASFHGDTNGLATIPVLNAIMAAMKQTKALPEGTTAKLLFGLDANTYEVGTAGVKQDVMEWGQHYVSHGLTSCWGDVPQKTNYTTYNARTYLQPQLNKACKRTDKRSKGDVNPKDFILFSNKDYKVVQTWKDNTGKRTYQEDMAFPTLQFPSDHGILTTILEPLTPPPSDGNTKTTDQNNNKKTLQ